MPHAAADRPRRSSDGVPPVRVVLRDAARSVWLEFGAPHCVRSAARLDEVFEMVDEVARRVERDGVWAVVLLGYECSPAFDPALVVWSRPDTEAESWFPLAWCAVFDRPRIDERLPCGSGRRGHCGGEEASGPDDRFLWAPSVAAAEYRGSLRTIKDHIARGDTYQVNYSYRLRAALDEEPWDLFTRMVSAQGPGCAAFVGTEDWAVCSASPELFFDLDDGVLTSRPMKGTASRGLWSEDDALRRAQLAASEKDRAENVMIVDMVRNDLGRVAEVGSVEVTDLFAIEKYPTVWQMTSTVRCRTEAAVPQVLRALFPAASITGAPKSSTMRIIADLETAPRRIYTGSVGFLSPGRRAQFNVAIRTVLVNRRTGCAEYGVGGGITWYSEPAAELEETHHKAHVLTAVRPEFELLETILWTQEGGYHLLCGHLRRLQESAEYFTFPWSRDGVARALEQEEVRLRASAERSGHAAWKVRLVLSEEGAVRVTHALLDNHGETVRVCLAVQPIHSADPLLYHKTTWRSRYEAALSARPGCDDVLLWNEHGEVTESTIANVVVERDGGLYTPPLRCGLLPGVLRGHLIDAGVVQETIIRVEDLADCSAVYLASSVRGLRRAAFIA